MRELTALVVGLVALAAINFGIYEREKLLAQGNIVLLELAPVDPRSLMQGDYMALRFKVATEAFSRERLPTLKDGHIVVTLDARKVATFKRFADSTTLAAGETLLRYRMRNQQPKFATNAFFFQEGHAHYYEKARYGEFRTSADGEAILTALRGANIEPLGPPPAAKIYPVQ